MTNRRMRYPDEVVDRVKQVLDLVDAVSKETRLKRSGKLMSGRCPHSGHKDRDASFVVDPVRNLYHCYSTSCALNERWFSPIDWMLHFRGARDFNEAMEMLGGEREQLPEPVRQQMAAANKAKLEEREQKAQADAENSRLKGRKIFAAGGGAKGTLVETYLHEARGLVGFDVGIEVLRFHPDLPYWYEVEPKVYRVIHSGPAMLAAFQDRYGNFSAVHQTWLQADGSDKADIRFNGERLNAKKIRGPFMGSAIRLSPPAPTMFMGEGIETTGEVVRLGRAGWVAGTLGNLTGASDPDAPREPHPADPQRRLPSTVPDMNSLRMAVPSACEREILIADGDTKDLEALQAALTMAERRIRQEGRAASQLWPKGRQDLNDYGRQVRAAHAADSQCQHIATQCVRAEQAPANCAANGEIEKIVRAAHFDRVGKDESLQEVGGDG